MLSAIAQRSVLLSSRRQAHSASLERYGLIRSFFLRQVNTPASVAFSVRISAQITARPHHTSNYGRYPPSIDVQRSLRRLHGARSVHTTTRLAQNDKQNRPLADTGAQKEPPSTDNPAEKGGPDPRQYENYSKYFRTLAMSLPHLHRPTRDDFLNAATGFWSRLRIRFKWLTIRSFRKYNADDISAFVTWFFMSQTLWLFVGTYVDEIDPFIGATECAFIYSTTFFSVVFATINSLRLQRQYFNSCYHPSLIALYRICCKGYQRLSDLGNGHHYIL